MEYAQYGRLFDVLHNETVPTDSLEFSAPVLRDVVSAMVYLHGLEPVPLLHRDLRSVTVLVVCNDGAFGAKITDLGLDDQLITCGLVRATINPRALNPKQGSGETGPQGCRSVSSRERPSLSLLQC